MWGAAKVLTTFFGSIIFPLVVGLIWGKLAEEYKTFGGILAGFFVVGTVWLLNHGIGLIYEPQMTGEFAGPWSDQGLTAFWGLFVADLFSGKKVNWNALLSAILGGALGGLLLYSII